MSTTAPGIPVWGLVARLSPGRLTGAILGLVAVCTYLAVSQDVFLTWTNWQNIFRSNAIVLILALGMTFVVLTAGIDLSVASMTVASGMIFGLALQEGWPWLPTMLATLGVGTAMGLVNGILIGIGGISFFVVTLGTLSIYASIALLSTFGETITLYDFAPFETSSRLANDNVGPVPVPLLLCAGLYLIGAFVLKLTAFGRAVYAVGSNAEAARLSGIRTTLVLVGVYTISGLTAGIAAVVATGRLGASAPQVDPTLMLTVVAAVLIGGTSYTGGEGGLLGSIVGVLFLGVVQNGLTLSSVSAFWQGTVSGLILIVAVGLGVLRDRGVSVRSLTAWRRRAHGRGATTPRHETVEAVTDPLSPLDEAQAVQRLRSQLERSRSQVRALEDALAELERKAEAH